jgi:hypothetical protein
MDDVRTESRPLIHCTPPTDPAFLASVSRSYADATEFLSGEAAVFVGTLVRLRMTYPMAAIIPLPLADPGTPLVVWLVSREGWTEIEPVPPREPAVGKAATATQAPRPPA